MSFLYYKGGCVFVCGHSNVQLTSPPVLKLWDTQGYLWLSYDLNEDLIGGRFEPKKILYGIPSALLSFLPDYCHSFQIIVISSILVSFLPNIVIPSKIFRELWILTSSKRFPYPKSEKNGHRRWPYMRVSNKKAWNPKRMITKSWSVYVTRLIFGVLNEWGKGCYIYTAIQN